MPSEFTKGPWSTTGHFVYGPNDEDIAELNSSDNGPIVSAAPELLEALKNARIVLGEAGSAEHVKQLTDTELGALWITVTRLADAAIAKAEGTHVAED